MAEHYIASGALFWLEELQEFIHPAYMVYARESDSPVVEQALQLLREPV